MSERVEAGGMEAQKEGLDVVGVVRLLLAHRRWISGCVLVATVLGVVYALLAPPVYSSYATLGLKDRDQGDGTTRLLSQFSAMGGGGAMANNTLNKMEVILGSYELAEDVVQAHPDLIPQLFPKRWDSERKAWKPKYAKRPPTLDQATRVLRGYLEVTNNVRKGFITMEVRARSASLAKRVADAYLLALRDKIRIDVMQSADADRRYLEAQLNNTLDPILQEKIQGMIAFQIEKSMLVSSQAFEVLERPIYPRKKIGPQRKKIVLTAFMVGLLFAVGTVYARLGWKTLRMALREGESIPRAHNRS
jgi:uncharacterized protein involved in exopolysaccharide biosynthesis